MKILTGALITTLLLAATPAMADRGYDKHRDQRDHWQQDRHARHFKHHGPRHFVVRRDVVHYYEPYRPAPVYYAPPAPLGVSIVLPNIFIPIR